MVISPDWALVILTAVYVLATIAICWANFKSAAATREQVAEIQKEYAENNRPIISVELDLEQRVFYKLKLVNNGLKPAKKVRVVFDDGFLQNAKNTDGMALLCKQLNKECIIGIGQHYDLFLFSVDSYNKVKPGPIKGIVYYQANELSYKEQFDIDIDNYMTFFSTDTDAEKMRKLMEAQNKALKDIRVALEKR